MFDLIAQYGEKIGAAFVALAGILGTRYLWGKITTDWARGIAQRAYNEVVDAVLEVWQTYVSEIVKDRADGVLTDAEKAEAKQRALDIAKSNLGPKGLARLARALGFGSLTGTDTAQTSSWIGSKVETAVASLKNAGALNKIPGKGAVAAAPSVAAVAAQAVADPQ